MTLTLLLAMAGFMVGAIVGELRDQQQTRQDAADEAALAEIDAYFARIRAAFTDDTPPATERAA